MSTKPDKYLLGYLGSYGPADQSQYGGILVTNEYGVPREFRHTNPIRPTKIQQILYGDSLQAAIGGTSIGPALISSLTIVPHILLIDRISKPLLGDFVEGQGPCALMTVAPNDEGIFMDSVGPNGMMHDPLQLRHGDVPNSFVFAYVDWTGSGSDPRRILEEVQHTMNIQSPFERVRTVLQHIFQAESAKSR
jgi:hypothetical protein